VGCQGKSDDYYRILREFSEGKDFYDTLGVSPTATASALKKAYHKQSLRYHPDKNKDPAAGDTYLLIQRAYEVLSNEEKKAEYDLFRKEGIPYHERYYGVFMHEWGAPQHDIRVVAAGLVVIITIAKHMFQEWRHTDMKRRAKETLRYKKAMKEAKAKGEEIDEIEVKVHGAERPGWRDLFVVQLAFLPFQPFIFGRSVYQNWGVPRKTNDQIWQEKLGLDDEQYALWKDKQIQKYQERMNSNKMKQYQRWMKKR